MRDDFKQAVKDTLAERVGYFCSNPACRKMTIGPSETSDGVSRIGVAAHICAASPGGPRYDANMDSEERKSIDNGIWLCQNCAHLIDTDTKKYTVEVLRGWKRVAEEQALKGISTSIVASSTVSAMVDCSQFGVSISVIEARLKAKTQPYTIDLGFFDYDENNIDEQLTEALRNQHTLNIKSNSKEEGLYYILRVIKGFLPDLADKVIIVETESNWHKLNGHVKDHILIPMFTVNKIDIIPGNKMIFIYTAEDFGGKALPIEVPNRTKSNLFNKLNVYLHDPEKTHNIIERTSGVYASLMRQLTCKSCFNSPTWRIEDVKALIPVALFGAWTIKEGDKELIAQFTGKPYDDYIVIIRKYLEKEDPFLIRFESYYGAEYRVVDPLEAIECIKPLMNSSILGKFRECLLNVFIMPHSYLNEFGITSETGKYSATLKRGIAKTLIVMSLCDYAYGDGYGENFKSFVNRVIQELMDRLHSKSEWEAVCEFIPLLIEAAPSAILAKLEECVAANDEVFWSLFEPGQNSFFPNSIYVSILDALSLAMYLDVVPVRALQVLESLAERNIVYKLGNTPISVLAATFSPVLAIVDMSLERKVSLVNSYSEKYPRSCWLVLKEILAADFHAVSMVPSKPLYHLPKTIPQKLTYTNVIDTMKQYYLIAFRCAGKDVAKWADFFDTGFFISYGFRNKVVFQAGALVSDSNVNDEDKYTFEKAIRRFLHNQRLLGDNSSFKEEDLSYIELNLLNLIQYQDPVYKILYAFDGRWLDIHPSTLDEENAVRKDGHFNHINKYSDEQKRVLQEIFVAGRIKLCDLMLKATDSYDLGQHIYETCHNSELQQDFAYFLFRHRKTESLRGYLSSALGSMDNVSFFNTFKQVSVGYEEIDFIFKLLTSHKIDEDFILRLQALPQEIQNYFWENITNPWIAENDTRVIEKYLLKTVSVGNCQDALDWIYLYDFSIEIYLLILESVLRFDTRLDAYQAQKIFEKIYTFKDIDEKLKERILHLEESYAQIFTEECKPKFLLDCLKCDPFCSVNHLYNIFGQNNNKKVAGSTVVATNDESDKEAVTTMEIAKRKAEKSFQILFHIHFCPCEKDGNIDYQELDTWCESYLKAIKEKGIIAIGESYLGQFLAYCPFTPDGEAWPLPAVCKAIEKYYSKELQDGFVVAVLNSRGTHSPHKGEEEKSLAQKYEDYAKVLEVSYPKSASIMRFISDVYRGDAKVQRSRAEHEYC